MKELIKNTGLPSFRKHFLQLEWHSLRDPSRIFNNLRKIIRGLKVIKSLSASSSNRIG